MEMEGVVMSHLITCIFLIANTALVWLRDSTSLNKMLPFVLPSPSGTIWSSWVLPPGKTFPGRVQSPALLCEPPVRSVCWRCLAGHGTRCVLLKCSPLLQSKAGGGCLSSLHKQDLQKSLKGSQWSYRQSGVALSWCFTVITTDHEIGKLLQTTSL